MVEPGPGAGEAAPALGAAPVEIARLAEAGQDLAQPERMVFFSDAVVAIAITLLAIDLPPPVGEDRAQLLESLRENTPEYLSFLLSFTVIAIHWRHHNWLFQHVAQLSGRVVVLNFGWLLLVVVTPFMTRLLGSSDVNFLTFGMYATTQALQLTIFAAMGWTLVRQRLLRDDALAPYVSRGPVRALTSAAAFAISVPVYAVIEKWAFVCWAVLPTVAGWLRKKERRAHGHR